MSSPFTNFLKLEVADVGGNLPNARPPLVEGQSELQNAILAILDGYSRGTRFGIRMDNDGLLAAGERGVQLTWMDAKVGEWVVTPRAGKPVEIQALWLNALKIASQFSPAGRALRARFEIFPRQILERESWLPLRRH